MTLDLQTAARAAGAAARPEPTAVSGSSVDTRTQTVRELLKGYGRQKPPGKP